MLIIFLVCLVIFVIGVALAVKSSYDNEGLWVSIAVIGGIGAFAFGIWTGVVFNSSLSDYSKLIASRQVIPIHKMVIEETKNSAPMTLGKSIVGDAVVSIPGIENAKQSTNNSDRLKEYRDYIKETEERICNIKLHYNNWFYRIGMAPMPPEVRELIK